MPTKRTILERSRDNVLHKRVQELKASGIIEGFYAEIDIRAARGTSIVVFGRSGTSSPTELYKALGADDQASMVLVGSGNFVFVGAMLRSINALEQYLDFVRKEGSMPRAIAGLHTIRPSGVRMAGRWISGKGVRIEEWR